MNKSLTERYAAHPADFNFGAYYGDAAEVRDAVIADLTQEVMTQQQGLEQDVAQKIAKDLLTLQHDYHALLGSGLSADVELQTTERIRSRLITGEVGALLRAAEERWQKAADELLKKHGM